MLVDDGSSDGTAETAESLGRRPGHAGALRVTVGTPPPAGWAGKVWAMAQGAAAAGECDYLLFTDADIAFAPGAVRDLVPRRDRRRPGPAVPDGAAACGHWLGAVHRAGVRLLLRPALSVPAGRPAPGPHRRGGRRLHAGAAHGAGGSGRP